MEEEQQLIWESLPPESMVAVTVGRVMSTLLSARTKKLYDAVSRLSPGSERAALGTSKLQTDFHDAGDCRSFYFLKLVWSSSLRIFAGSLEDSLWFLHKYIIDAVEDKEAMDQILVPMIQHVFYSLMHFFVHF